MKEQRILFGLSAVFLLLVFIFSVYLSDNFTRQNTEVYFFPSADYLKLISGTFRPLSADMLFIKGVLEMSDEIPDRRNYLFNLFETSAELDPKLIGAYFFGGVAVPVNKEEIAWGINFLKKGMKLNPYEWRIPFWIGFNYLELGIYSKAAQYYRIASDLPGSPRFLKTNLAFLYYKAGDLPSGILYLEGLSQSLKDKRLLEIIDKKINWLKGLVYLEGKVQDYKDIYGLWPSDLEELLDKGIIKEVPLDPFGKGYYLQKDTFHDIPKVRSKFDFF